MFAIGEYIVYGSSGICRVEKICASPCDPADPRDFYLLVPLHNPTGSTIYTPVDNVHVPMRALMSSEEISELIGSIPDIEPLIVPLEKQRRELCYGALATLRPTSYVQVLKAVDERKKKLAAARKHCSTTDMEVERLAKHMLYSECAYVLGLREEEMETYIAERLPREIYR